MPRTQQLFASHLSRFYVIQTEDSVTAQAAKLQILVNLVNAQNIQPILRELMVSDQMAARAFFPKCLLQVYVQSPDPQLIGQVVNSIGDCASRVPRVRERCLRALTKLVVRQTSRKLPSVAPSRETR